MSIPNWSTQGPFYDYFQSSPWTPLYYVGTHDQSLIYGSRKDDTLFGANGGDLIFADSGDDKVFGNLGNDTLQGDSGNDLLQGGSGDDFLFGMTHDDFLYGDKGSDHLFGGSGDDVLVGAQDRDFLTGGEGCDTFILHSQYNGSQDVIYDYEVDHDTLSIDIDYSRIGWYYDHVIDSTVIIDPDSLIYVAIIDGQNLVNQLTSSNFIQTYA